MNIHVIMIVALLLYTGAALSFHTAHGRAGHVLILLGIFANAAVLVLHGYVGGSWYPALMIDEKLSLPLFLALIGLAFFRTGKNIPGRAVTVALVLCSLAAFLPVPGQALPSVKTQVFSGPAFFLTETIGLAFFTAGGFLALAALLFHRDTDGAIRQCVLWGFVVFTLCQVLGAVWAFSGWSYPFSWSPRHLASAGIWCLYAALLHAGVARVSSRVHDVLAVAGLVPISYMLFYHEFSAAIVALAEIIP